MKTTSSSSSSTAHKESEQHRDGLGPGSHLSPAAVSGHLQLRLSMSLETCISELFFTGRRGLRHCLNYSGDKPVLKPIDWLSYEGGGL